MHLIFRTALMLCTMLVFVAQALAADVRSYAVLPFKVNGSSGFTYLEKAIPSMLNSRLYALCASMSALFTAKSSGY